MSTQANACHTLEDLLLLDDIGEPLSLKLSLLETITDKFSKERIIGSGGYGTVYKGVLGDELVAVKKLYSFHAIEDEPFQHEVDCLMRIRHCNIVWFVGYCAETCVEAVRKGDKTIFVNSQEKLLCFEYLQNGSLRNHLTAGPGLQCQICYQIIKGICQGLHYLHQKQIIHLDLKPDNILLDDCMVPKIADFGLSRLLGEEKSRMVTQRKYGTMRYMAPEYLLNGEITFKSDIYSFGLIIREMVMGPSNTETTTENVLESRRRRVEQDASKMRQTPDDLCYLHIIEACTKVSKTCIEGKPGKRPTTGDILRWLEKAEAEAGVRSIAAATPAVEWLQKSSLSRLMQSMQLVAVTSSQQPSTQGEGSKALQPGASQLTLPKGPADVSPDKSCWLDTRSNAKCYMLSSRLLQITWGETPGHWKWVTLPDSRFAECAELLNVYFLAVIGELAIEDLTPGTRYAVYLVYKLTMAAIGLKGGQMASVRLYGERTVSTKRVSVDPTARGMTGVTYPVTRGDGWMELKLAEFVMDEMMLTEKAVIVDFREVNDNVKKSGLIIEGMEFRTNN